MLDGLSQFPHQSEGVFPEGLSMQLFAIMFCTGAVDLLLAFIYSSWHALSFECIWYL